MIKNIEGFRALVAGITRMGKSYFVKKTVIPQLVEFKPVVIFDRKEEYAGRRAVDHDKKWLGFTGSREFFKHLKEDGGKLRKRVYVVNCRRDSDYINLLRFFRLLREPVSLLLDEAHDIFLDSDFYNAKKELIKITRYGASDGIDLALISQRTKDIPPNIRSQFLWAVSFKQTHKDDVKALDERGWENAEKVLDLDRRDYQVFGDVPKHLKIK